MELLSIEPDESEVIDVYKSKSGQMFKDPLSRDVWEKYEEKTNPASAHSDSAKWTTSKVKINPRYMSVLPQEQKYDPKSTTYNPKEILQTTRKNKGGIRRKTRRKRQKKHRKKTRRKRKGVKRTRKRKRVKRRRRTRRR